MDDSNERKFQKELNGGLVGLVLLAVLAESDEDLYGYEIAKRLANANDGTSIFKEGTIYPVLAGALGGEFVDQPHRAFVFRAAAPLLPHHRARPHACWLNGSPSGRGLATSSIALQNQRI